MEKSVMKTERMLPLVVNQFGCHHRCLSYLSSGYYRYFYSLVTWTEFPQVHKTLEITWRHGRSLFSLFFNVSQVFVLKYVDIYEGVRKKFFRFDLLPKIWPKIWNIRFLGWGGVRKGFLAGLSTFQLHLN